MIIPIQQIELIKNSTKHNEKPITEFFSTSMNKVKLSKLELLKIEIREFYKNNRCVTVECEELIESIDKKIFEMLEDK